MDLVHLAEQIKPSAIRLDMSAELHNDNCFRASAKLVLCSVGVVSIQSTHFVFTAVLASQDAGVHNDP